MLASFVKKTFVNIYLLQGGEITPVCCPLQEINDTNFNENKVLAIVNALTPCLDSSVSVQSIKKVEGYVIAYE